MLRGSRTVESQDRNTKCRADESECEHAHYSYAGGERRDLTGGEIVELSEEEAASNDCDGGTTRESSAGTREHARTRPVHSIHVDCSTGIMNNGL